MKWTYKNCDVEITVTFDSLAEYFLTPIVAMDCRTPGLQTMLTTQRTFRSTETAEQCGMDMAKDWIDAYFSTSASTTRMNRIATVAKKLGVIGVACALLIVGWNEPIKR